VRTEPDAFTLFASYHLGLTADGEYRFQNLHQVAERLGLGPQELLDALARERLDPDSLLAGGYDLASAQVDAMSGATPEERLAAARRHFDALRATHGHGRDWERELAEDAAENERVFGKPDAHKPDLA
jgi:hypothetical protein